MTTDEPAIDAILDALADGQRRTVLAYLQNASEATVEELAAVMEKGDSGLRPDGCGSEVVAPLHHVHLPKLAEADLVEYDRESGQVQYVGGSEILPLLGTAPQEPIPE